MEILKVEIGEVTFMRGVDFEVSKPILWKVTNENIVVKLPARSVWNDRWSRRNLKGSFLVFIRITDRDTDKYYWTNSGLNALEFGITKPEFDTQDGTTVRQNTQ